MPRTKVDPDKADELPFDATPARAPKGRHIGARQLGGVWYAADGGALTAVETQQAHRAMDAAAAEARRKALLGGGE